MRRYPDIRDWPGSIRVSYSRGIDIALRDPGGLYGPMNLNMHLAESRWPGQFKPTLIFEFPDRPLEAIIVEDNDMTIERINPPDSLRRFRR